MAHKHGGPWTERTGRDEAPEASNIPPTGGERHNQAFKSSQMSMGAVHSPQHSSLGVSGHIIHMAGVFIPVIAGELIQDATQYKKVVRLASIGTALAYEAAWTIK